jgi:tetratricopeptide (TPR) repeat protein
VGKTTKLLLLTAISAALLLYAVCAPAAESNDGVSSMVGSFNSGVKKGFAKVSDTVFPKSKPLTQLSDETSLMVKAKPSAKLYAAAASMYASNGDIPEAEAMYKKALEIESDNAEALAGLALLKDQQGAYGEATILFEKAAKAHPDDAAVFNAMGLCHATHGNLKPALSALEQAVRIKPRELKYRNNIAMVLVEMGRYEEALSHFRTQYEEPVAHYNLAYLLQKRGDNQKAMEHFAAALRQNPRFEEARTWYNHLAGQQSAGYPPQQGSQTPAQIGMATPPAVSPSLAMSSGGAPFTVSPPMPAQTPQTRFGSQMPAGAGVAAGGWMPQNRQYFAASGSTPAVVIPPATAMTPPAMASQVMPPPEVAQNAMQRAWYAPQQRSAVPSQQPFFVRRPPAVDQTMPQREAPRNEAIAQSQFEALGPPAPPIPTAEENKAMADSRFGFSEVASGSPQPGAQPPIQRLPPIEQSFESQSQEADSPELNPQEQVQQAPGPLAPLPSNPTSKLILPSGNARAGESPAQAAPLPGSTEPSTPPAAGTTRAPMVYPLPPVNEYRQ